MIQQLDRIHEVEAGRISDKEDMCWESARNELIVLRMVIDTRKVI